MNQETLNHCFQTLIQQNMEDLLPTQQVASSLPRKMSTSTLDCIQDSYSGLFHPVSRLNRSIEGLSFDGYQHGSSTVPTATSWKNIPSPMGITQSRNMVHCHEQESTVTSCSSGDGFSDAGTLNNPLVFDSALQIPHLLQKIPEVPSTLPRSDLEYQWPYMQFDKPSNGKAQFCFNERNASSSPIAEQIMLRTQFPSEPSYVVPVASMGAAPAFSSMGAATYAKPSTVEHQILCAYTISKSSVVTVGGSKASFMKYLHSTICNIHWCGCEYYSTLLSHFDGCQSSECHICGPVRYVPDTANHQKFDIMRRNFNDTDYGLHKSDCSSCLVPSSKRLKMDHPMCSFPTGVGISSLVDPLRVQSFEYGAVEPLQQLPESPKSINSEAGELNKLLRDPVKDTFFEGSGNSIADNYCVSHSHGVFTLEDFNFGSKMENKNLSGGSDIAEIFLDSNRLRSSVVPVHEEPSSGCREDEMVLRNKLNSTNPEIQTESVVGSIGPELDLTKPTTQNEFVAEDDNGKQIKSTSPRSNGVSLTEFFTAEQLRAHISSLRKWINQSVLGEETGNKTKSSVSESSCQLCLLEKLSWAPTPIYCSFCGAPIKCYLMYYSTSEENGMRHCFCTSCYKQSRGGKITVYGISISKAKMFKTKNDKAIDESWVQCDKCQGWQHQICALYNNKRDTEGKAEYICPKCRLKEIENGVHPPLAGSKCFAAKDLPCTMLSDHLELRLYKRLDEEREKKANISGKNLDEVPTAEDLVVRVVLSVDKQLKVKPQFLDILHEVNYPTEFPFRLKVILLFQKIEGVDVCLFGMYVQEFGSECSHPNQRCVYISYLDSVKYFRPEIETAAGKALRTLVYHEMLIGYLEYCKTRGFVTCYIWACPPVKGEDYILYCHPETQKTPKSDKLRHWYRSMLKKATEEKIVVGISNLYDQFFIPTGQHLKVTAARLPYFDGDYWSGAAESVIKSMEQESGDDFNKKLKKPMSKRTLKAMGHEDPSSNAAKDILLMQKLGQNIFPVKEDFIIVYLQFVCSHCHEVILYGHRWFCNLCKNFQLCERCHDAGKKLKGEDIHPSNVKEKHVLTKVMVDNVPCDTREKDILLDNTLFENRNAFLSFCQENYYQFDTLRRAKHSSMMILHHLHNLSTITAEGICYFCHKDNVMENCWKCEICTQFEVCTACYQEKGDSLHSHKLTQHFSSMYAGTESTDVQPKVRHVRENSDSLIHTEAPETIQLLMNLLQHATRCGLINSPGCSNPKCLQLRKMFAHTRKCSVRAAGGCQVCKRIWRLLCFHSKCCKEPDCSIPRCKDLKQYKAKVAKQRTN